MLPDIPILNPMPLTLDEQVRQRIRGWVESTGVTQKELGERIGRNQAWMSRYLSGEMDADLETLQKMAQAFEHTLSALLDTPTDPLEARWLGYYRGFPPALRTSFMTLLDQMARRLARPRRPR